MALLARHTRQISHAEKGNWEFSDRIVFGQRLKSDVQIGILNTPRPTPHHRTSFPLDRGVARVVLVPEGPWLLGIWVAGRAR